MIIAVLLLLALLGLFVFAYHENKKTPVPADCRNIQTGCQGCQISSCSLHPSHREDDVK